MSAYSWHEISVSFSLKHSLTHILLLILQKNQLCNWKNSCDSICTVQKSLNQTFGRCFIQCWSSVKSGFRDHLHKILVRTKITFRHKCVCPLSMRVHQRLQRWVCLCLHMCMFMREVEHKFNSSTKFKGFFFLVLHACLWASQWCKQILKIEWPNEKSKLTNIYTYL